LPSPAVQDAAVEDAVEDEDSGHSDMPVMLPVGGESDDLSGVPEMLPVGDEPDDLSDVPEMLPVGGEEQEHLRRMWAEGVAAGARVTVIHEPGDLSDVPEMLPVGDESDDTRTATRARAWTIRPFPHLDLSAAIEAARAATCQIDAAWLDRLQTITVDEWIDRSMARVTARARLDLSARIEYLAAISRRREKEEESSGGDEQRVLRRRWAEAVAAGARVTTFLFPSSSHEHPRGKELGARSVQDAAVEDAVEGAAAEDAAAVEDRGRRRAAVEQIHPVWFTVDACQTHAAWLNRLQEINEQRHPLWSTVHPCQTHAARLDLRAADSWHRNL
jgi:hypothetical protein